MTGRAAGYCAGYNAPGYANPVGGWGAGRAGGVGYGGGYGRGGYGHGWRHRYLTTGIPGRALAFGNPYAYGVPRYEAADERSFLMEQAEYLKSALEDINKRLDSLKSTKEEGKQS
jgi:hypothetical protein